MQYLQAGAILIMTSNQKRYTKRSWLHKNQGKKIRKAQVHGS